MAQKMSRRTMLKTTGGAVAVALADTAVTAATATPAGRTSSGQATTWRPTSA
jgi:hypothetical protein